MRVLHIASGFPTANKPFYQPFIKSQIDSLKKLGIEIELLDIEGNRSKFNYIKSIYKLNNILKVKNIDLIHAHYSFSAFPAILAKTKIPIVVSLMGSDILGSPNEKGKITFRGRIDKILSKLMISKVNHLIVKSKGMKNLLKTKVPMNVIPNGIDFDFFKPQDKYSIRNKIKIDNDEFVVLFLGNPKEYRKNLRLAEKSVNSFKKKVNIKISLVTPYGISPEEVVDYMNAADVLLSTSFWEGSPNVIKEAMSCNLPIISTDVGDVKEVINNTSNCFLVDYSEEEISEKLKIIYSNRERSNGRNKIHNLRIEIIAEKIINLYKSILKNSNS